MKINQANICSFCRKLFCCANCRKCHVEKSHPEHQADCPLCNNAEFLPFPSNDPLLLAHIKQNHLPLGCRKCAIIVEKAGDQLNETCLLVKLVVPPDITVTTAHAEKMPDQRAVEIKEAALLIETPKSKFNLKLSQTTYPQTGPLSSSSLIKCASAAYMSMKSNGVTTRLIRSTSTPTATQELVIPHITLNATQMSSIYNQSSELVTNSPIGIGMGCTPGAPKVVDKFKFPMRLKNSSNVTPLRQVMSQNVQRALLNHEFMTQPQHSNSPGSQPLDLRTKRRSFSGSPKIYEPLQEEEAVTEEPAIVVSSTDSVVPETKSTDNVTLLPSSKNSESPDVFYTPIAQQRHRRRSSIFTCVRLEEYLEYSDDFSSELATATTTRENTASYTEEPKPIAGAQENKVSLWNVLSTVFRFASNNLIARIESHNETTLTDNEESVNIATKRRLPSSPGYHEGQSPRQSPKRTRIQGRRPIARMRQLNEK